MELPIDGQKLSFVISEPATPRRDFQTGEQRTDKASGRGIWDVVLLAGDGAQSMPIKVKLLEDCPGQQMTPVKVDGLMFVRLEMRDGTRVEYFTAKSITPATAGGGGAAKTAPAAGQSSGQAAGQPGGQSAGQAAGKAGA